MFDGKSKKGWHIYRGEGTGKSWQVENGMLVYIPDTTKGVKNGGDLTTDTEFENYHFSVEWKISEGGNSGIIFNVSEDSVNKKSYLTGMEMQVLDNDRHADAKIPKHRAGDLYDLISSSKESAKPVGEGQTKVTIPLVFVEKFAELMAKVRRKESLPFSLSLAQR